MTMEAARMRGIAVTPESFDAENKVIQEERRQRTDNDPRAQLMEQMRENLFPNHPYSMPVIGWMHEIKALQWADAKTFYDLYYAPNNAIVVVAGDVKAQDVFDLAARTYGVIARADTPARVRTQSPPFIGEAVVILEHETIKEPVIRRTYRVPGFRQNAEKSLALEVLADIMGAGSTSRLYKSLVIEQKIASTVSLSYNPAVWDDAALSITATPVSADHMDAVEDAIDEELYMLIQEGVTGEELSDSIGRLQAEAVYARDSLSGPAMITGRSLVTGATLDDVEYWPERIAHVTAEQIRSVAKQYLDPDNPSGTPPVTGILLPEEGEKKEESGEK